MNESQLNYHAEGMFHWDTWYLAVGDMVHMYHLQVKRPDSKRPDLDGETVGHAISRDLIHWKEQPVALYRGPVGSYDEGCLFTGCAYLHENVIYLYYCGNQMTRKPEFEYSGDGRCRQSMCLAISKDNGTTYDKYPGNPIIEPDPKRYYSILEPAPEFKHHAHPHIDCRDICVIPDPAGNGWLGYVVMRRKGYNDAFHSICIVLCRSKDLIHWDVGDPVCAPNRLNCFEVPDVFQIGNKWYMIALTGDVYGQSARWADPETSCATVVFQSDSAYGPFEEARDNLILASKKNVWQGFSARTVLFCNERLMLFTRCENINGRGSLAWPVKLVPRKEGGLNPVYWHGIDDVFGKAAVLADKPIPMDKQALNVVTDIKLASETPAGISLGNYSALLDSSGQVILSKQGTNEVIQNRLWNIERDKTYKLRLVISGKFIDIYVDDILVMDYYLPELIPGNINKS